MVKQVLFLFAAMIFAVNLALAADGNSKAVPAPAVDGKAKATAAPAVVDKTKAIAAAPAVDDKAKASATPAPPFKNPATGMELVYVKGGCYQMGDTFGDGGPEEKPVHKVCLDDFYVGKYEVTQGQWEKIMGGNPSVFGKCGEKCPVDSVSWNDAQAFISKLNSKSSLEKSPSGQFRLPTEAEWEYAARSGGKNEKYSGGNDLDSFAWYSPNSLNTTHSVGTKSPNGLGIYDMTGNVWEWTNDWYGSDYYSNSSGKNPAGPDSGVSRVLRGGGWGLEYIDERTSYRNYLAPDYRGGAVGFRLLMTPPPMLPQQIIPTPQPPPVK